jgi:hypothetical protein
MRAIHARGLLNFPTKKRRRDVMKNIAAALGTHWIEVF